MSINLKSNPNNVKLLNNIGVFAAVFALFVALLITVNYFQLNTANPLKTKTIDQLVERLNEQPKDEALREEIRTLDLLVRKAYFTNQWQIRMGGYLLIISIIIAIIAFRTAQSLRNERQQVVAETTTQVADITQQRWVAIGGAVFFGVALVFAFLSHQQLSTTLQHKITKITEIKSENNTTEIIAIEEQKSNEENKTIEDTLKTTAIDTVKIKKDSVIIAVKENDSTEIVAKKTVSEYPSYKEIYQNSPSFRGPGGNGVGYQKNVPTSWDGASGKNILWKKTLPLQGYNAPIIWGDKVFLSGANKTERAVYCMDLQTGELLWTGTADNIKGSPATPPKVTEDTGLAASSVATDGRKVYAIFGTGDLICFDMDGKRLWARNIGVPQNHYGHSSSLIAYRNMLYVQYDQKRSAKIMALNTNTGKTIWSTDRKVKISWASPILVNTGKQMELILCADPLVVSYNPFSGKELWSSSSLSGEVGPSAAYADGVIYVVNEYAKMVAVKTDGTAEVLWEYDEVLSDVASPVATKDFVYLAASYGSFVCLNSKSGETLWSHDYDEGFYASPMIVGEKLYLTDISGRTYILAVQKDHKMIGQNTLGEKVFSTPAFADNKILIRGKKNLYCIGK